MTDTTQTLILAASSLAAVAMVTLATLAGWRGWLALQDRQRHATAGFDAPSPMAGTRIEIADLKERIRKLEAIAAGVEL